MKTLIQKLIFIAILTLFSACGGGNEDSAPPPDIIKYNSNINDIALLDESITLEAKAYNDLVLILSQNGTKKLFDIADINDSQYETLIDIVNNLDTANAGYLKVAISLESKHTADSVMQSAISSSQKAASLDMGIGELIGKLSVNGLQHLYSNQSELIAKIISKIKFSKCQTDSFDSLLKSNINPKSH